MAEHATAAMANGHAGGGSGAPVCLIRGGSDGLRVAEEGVRMLEQLREPVAVVCLAGQYRTGKSFFLNQLARADTRGRGFRVGPTTESCTRGIWLWDPEPAVRNARGERVLFMDTEGIAATDNDESYDAKIFSLGLLLSSLFVFNTMGVIDEGAIDRLFLVSELTKHVCVSTDTSTDSASAAHAVPMGGVAVDGGDGDGDGEWKDALAESRQLAPHFPPFMWLLRDFMLDMQADGSSLTPNEYLEKSLEPRDGASRRNEDRNRIRASIRVLFARRECLTLVRPVMDESQLRRAAELQEEDLRTEFVDQMRNVRDRILAVVSPKQMFGKVMDGSKLAHLARCYTDTMNSGSIPDIKAAWAYVSEATCQTAMLTAMEVYDHRMRATHCHDNDDGDDDQQAPIISQQEFEKIHKDAQEEALNLFKNQSVEGATRTVCFQKLKTHVQKQKTALIAVLQKRSTAQCETVLSALKAEFLVQPMEAGKWDEPFFHVNASTCAGVLFEETMNKMEELYESRAQGPAQKTTFFHFLRKEAVQFYETLFARLAKRFDATKHEWEKQLEQLGQSKDALESQLRQQLHDKAAEIKLLDEAKAHAAEKDQMQLARIQELLHQAEQQSAAIATSEDKRRQQKAQLEALQSVHATATMDLEKTKLQAEHTSESLRKAETELAQTKKDWHAETEAQRRSHEQEKEDWIQKLADQTAEKSSAQRTLKQRDHELQQKVLAMEMVRKENEQLEQVLDGERKTRKQKEDECTRLREQNVAVEKRLEESFGQQMTLQDELERERTRLEARLERFQVQLGRVEADKEVEEVLRDAVTEVVRLAEVDKANVLLEERNVLQERLGEMFVKISTLPEFYQREIFCSPEPEPSFFDALTQ